MLKKALLLLSFFFIMVIGAEEKWSPDYLLIGAQKAGTTALFDYINQHPKVVNKSAEVHFFDLNFYKGVEWYKSKFPARPDESYVIGDKSPYYLFHPSAAERAYSLYPAIKIVMILRNPVSRAYSHYWFNKNRSLERLTFEEALDAEPRRLLGQEEKILSDPNFEGKVYRLRSYKARGRYAEQIENWLEWYDLEQMLIVDADELRANPQETLDKVYAFLGLDSHTLNLAHNEDKTSYPAMDAATKNKLKAYFAPYNKDLENLLNRKFKWSK